MAAHPSIILRETATPVDLPDRPALDELAEPFALSLPAVSKHLKVLQRAGLISQGRRAQWRPCRLRPERLRDVADWVGQYRRHWEASFDRLDEYLRKLQETEKNDGDATR